MSVLSLDLFFKLNAEIQTQQFKSWSMGQFSNRNYFQYAINVAQKK